MLIESRHTHRDMFVMFESERAMVHSFRFPCLTHSLTLCARVSVCPSVYGREYAMCVSLSLSRCCTDSLPQSVDHNQNVNKKYKK